jgi:hypothetical protein
MENASIDYDGYNLFDIPNQTGTPERRLILALLERAILDFVGNEQKEALESEQWIFNDDLGGEDDQFSFNWTCLQLDLDANHIRRKIREMPKRGLSRLAPWYMKEASISA